MLSERMSHVGYFTPLTIGDGLVSKNGTKIGIRNGFKKL